MPYAFCLMPYAFFLHRHAENFSRLFRADVLAFAEFHSSFSEPLLDLLRRFRANFVIAQMSGNAQRAEEFLGFDNCRLDALITASFANTPHPFAVLEEFFPFPSRS